MSEKKEEKLFDSAALRRLITPLIIEQFFAVSVGMIDTLMVSLSGQEAVAGVALVDNINRLMIQTMAALATGGAVVCSHYLGMKEEKEAKKAVGQLELITLAFSLFITLVCLFFTKPLLRAIFGSVDESVLKNAITYFVVTSLSYPFLGLYNSGASVFRALGDSRISMRISLVMNIINVVGNAVLVLVFNMSVMGVALATLLSRAVAGFIICKRLMSQANPIRPNIADCFKPKFKYIRKILYIGVPSGVENGLFQVGKLMVVSIVSGFGTASIAANSVAYTITDLICIPASSMGLALITVVGRCIGAQDYFQARYYTRKLVKFAYIGAWITNIALFLFCPYMTAVFNLSGEANEIAINVLRAFAAVSICIWPLSFTISNSLRAAGDVTFTMIVSVASMLIFRVGSSWIFGVVFGMGVMGVWIGMFIDWAVRSVFFVRRYLSEKWLKAVT
ncbi:MAG TPA: MATE family efflux transporter [Lachnospiraceae bacterium]|nr:MATE family efflux transporter [Lachnospiraceae bacterium]